MRNPPNTQENLNTRGILIDLGRSTATELKRASPEFPRASNLLPRRKTPSSGEIASFPETLWGEGTLDIEPKFHNVAVLHDVIFSFEAEFTGFFNGGFGS